MATDDVPEAVIAGDIEGVLRSSGVANAASLASEIAGELVRKYEMRGKPERRKSYEGSPRGGQIW